MILRFGGSSCARCGYNKARSSRCCSPATGRFTSAEPICPSAHRSSSMSSTRHGVSHDDAIVRIGTISSLGVLAYALGKLFLGGLGDYWGGRVSFLDRTCGRHDLYFAIRSGGHHSPLHGRLVREPPDAVDRLGGSHQGFLQVVRLFLVRHDSGHPQPELPGRRRGGASDHGRAHRARLFVADALLLRGRGDCDAVHRELVPAARVAGRERLPRGADQSAQPVRFHGIARSQHRRTSASAAAEPGVRPRLPAVSRLHHRSRDVQHLDARVSARLPGVFNERRRRHERHLSRASARCRCC